MIFGSNTIQELNTFIQDASTGRMSAKGKDRDDRVMALALTWEQVRIIKENTKITDEGNVMQQKYDTMTGFPILG